MHPPPLQSLPFTQLSCLFSFTLTSPSSSPPLFFCFSFPSTSFISLVPFFSRQTMLFIPQVSYAISLFVSLPSAFISFSFPSSRMSFLSFFFNSTPDHITGRGSSQTVQTDAHISFNHIINTVHSDKAQDIKQLFMKRY